MKKISKLLIGTNNKGKYKEIKDLLPKYIKTYSTSEFKLKSPKEDGVTFTENSIIKSKYFSKKTRLICLADDSGLEIDILDKNPGIYSARWGGKNADFKKAINRNNFLNYNNKFFKEFNENPSHLALLSYDLVGLVYYLSLKTNLSNLNKVFKKKNSFKGKIGIFDIKNNKINHRLNFYKIEDKKIIEIF